MLKRERLINKLRALGYQFKNETDRTYMFRRGTHRAFVPKTDLISEINVRSILNQCGCNPAEVEEFIQQAEI
jgi:hypothetical protein